MDKNQAKKVLKGLMRRFNITVDDLIDEKTNLEASERMSKADDIVLEKLKDRLEEKQREPRQREPRQRERPRREQRSNGFISGGGSIASGGRPITDGPIFGEEGQKDISDRIWNRRK